MRAAGGIPVKVEPFAYAELSEAGVRQLVRESRALREKAEAISLALARVNAATDVLSDRSRRRVNGFWRAGGG